MRRFGWSFDAIPGVFKFLFGCSHTLYRYVAIEMASGYLFLDCFCFMVRIELRSSRGSSSSCCSC